MIPLEGQTSERLLRPSLESRLHCGFFLLILQSEIGRILSIQLRSRISRSLRASIVLVLVPLGLQLGLSQHSFLMLVSQKRTRIGDDLAPSKI